MPINRVVISGNLGRDPELREVGDTNVCSFSIPLNTSRKGEKTTAWLNVSAWNRLGEVCHEYLSKGSGVVVDGLLQVREYEKDGETKQVFEIRATDVHFAGGRNDARPASKSESSEKDGEDGLGIDW